MATVVDVFSLLMWIFATVFMLSWYKNRKKLGAGEVVWRCLFLACFFFMMRELGHSSTLPLVEITRYMLGIWSATFFVTGTYFVFWAYGTQGSEVSKKVPMYSVLGVIVVTLALALLAVAGQEVETVGVIFSNVEHLAWLAVGFTIICFTYAMGGKLPRRFVRVFFFFLMAFYCCTLWKFLAIINLFGGNVPYVFAETTEMAFGLLNALAFYDLSGILREVV